LSKLNGKILFIKPFEVDSSGTSFIDVWKNIRKTLRRSQGNQFAALLRSVAESAGIGFVSLSAWDSRLSFRKALRDSIIIKYHIMGNTSDNRSDLSFVYEVTGSRCNKIPGKGKELIRLDFIRSGKDAGKVIDYWNRLINDFERKGALLDSLLCKSVSEKAGFSYVIIVKFLQDRMTGIPGEVKVANNGIIISGGNYSSVYESNIFKNIQFSKF
jgi:hypothetical protein